jgi:hypothetical protein
VPAPGWLDFHQLAAADHNPSVPFSLESQCWDHPCVQQGRPGIRLWILRLIKIWKVTNHICNTQQLKHKISRFPNTTTSIDKYISRSNWYRSYWIYSFRFLYIKSIGNSFQAAAAVASAWSVAISSPLPSYMISSMQYNNCQSIIL